MISFKSQIEPPVIATCHPHMISIVLNRPRVLNCLNIEMIRLIQRAMDRARILEKDNRPRWRPGRIEEVGELELEV